MPNSFNPSVSIEEFAAFLDGNLTPSQMQEVALDIQSDSRLRSISAMSDDIDNSLDYYEINGLEIPEEIAENKFSLPVIESYPVIDDVVTPWGDPQYLHSELCCACEIMCENDINDFTSGDAGDENLDVVDSLMDSASTQGDTDSLSSASHILYDTDDSSSGISTDQQGSDVLINPDIDTNYE